MPLKLLFTKLTLIFFCAFALMDGVTNQAQSGDFKEDSQHRRKSYIPQRLKISEAQSESSIKEKELEQEIKSSSQLATVLFAFQSLLTWRAGCYTWNYDQFPNMPRIAIAATGPMASVFAFGLIKFMRDKDTQLDHQISKILPQKRESINKLKRSFIIEKNVIFTLITLEFFLLAYGAIFEPETMSMVFPGPKG